MAKQRTGDGEEIIEALRDALAYARGDQKRGKVTKVAVPHIDVKAIRTKLGMSQAEFALQFAFPISTLRNWEQGRRQPEGPARTLLKIIDRIPNEARKALATTADS